ncbi:hypothetical protein IW261DRAFT_1573288 [Armillaria novae-zelandiae]|uniref:Uncharacterized protein n=1 Tax=Armillaria novae-zelandiae TaxID=153914 RepID=A0AA39TWW8_9AGAR|nr:hypothetical protein IW261DRAFT_1573288 [Armillaria novae-zelandiae]
MSVRLCDRVIEIATVSLSATREGYIGTLNAPQEPRGPPLTPENRKSLVAFPLHRSNSTTSFLHSNHLFCNTYCSKRTRTFAEDQFWGLHIRRLPALGAILDGYRRLITRDRGVLYGRV